MMVVIGAGVMYNRMSVIVLRDESLPGFQGEKDKEMNGGAAGGFEWFATLYWACMILGGGYVVIQFVMLLLGGVMHGLDFGGGHAVDVGGGVGDVDLDAALDSDITSHSPGIHPTHGQAATGTSDIHIGPYSPMAIATFLAGFGGMGIALRAIGIPEVAGIPGAFVGGLLSLLVGFVAAAIVIATLNKFFEVTQASSEYSLNEAIGTEAVVEVPMDGATMGQITFHAGSATRTEPARPLDAADAFAQGDKVWIVSIKDGVFEVVDFDKALHLNLRTEDNP